MDDEPQHCERCYARAEKRRREQFCDELDGALRLSSNGAKVTARGDDGPGLVVEFEDVETSCGQLAAFIQMMEDVKSASAVDGEPEVFVDFESSRPAARSVARRGGGFRTSQWHGG